MTASRPPQPAALAVPRWLDRGAAWSWRLLLVGAFFVALLWLLSYIRLAVVPAMVAVVLATAVWPVTRRLVGWGLPRFLAALLPLAVMLGLVGFGLWFTGQRAATELTSNELETQQIRVEIEAWLMDEPLDLTQEQIKGAESTVRGALAGGARSWSTNQGGLAVTIASGAVLGLVLTFLVLKDGETMWAWAVRRVNPVRRAALDRAGRVAAATMAAYMRSVVITGVLDAMLIGLGLLFLGVPLIGPLMIVTFVSALFPVVGALVAGIAAVIVALVMVGPETALWVVVLALAVQQIEGNVIMPLLVGRQVSFHPAAVLLSLTAGAAIAGLAGAFLAVPVIAGVVSAMAVFRASTGTETAAGVAAEPVVEPEVDVGRPAAPGTRPATPD